LVSGHKDWFTRHSFAKKGLDINNPPTIQNRKQTTQSTNSNTLPTDTNTSRYQSNIIIQSSDNPIVIKAANALFNKHPNTSILVKFDQNGNLVTLKGETYTPTGNTRLNFVRQGADLEQEGAQSLADKVKTLQYSYSNASTNIKRWCWGVC
jgi:hypothetical protein